MSGLAIIARKLQSDADLIAKVPAQRIYPNKAGQGVAPPFIVLMKVGGSDGVHLNGQDDYPVHRIRVTALATSYAEAEEIGVLVLDALKNTIKSSIGAYRDVDIIFVGDFEDYGDEQALDRSIQDFRVRFRRA